jgi:predicted transcriptional regulator
MSIKPKWAKELYSGKKTVEFRKSSPPLGSLVFLYESTPVKAVTGCFRVQAVLTSNASHIWCVTTVLRRVWIPGSVNRNFLFEYCGGASGKCCAILADSPWRFPEAERVKLEKYAVRPPQSWQTLRADNSGENALARSLLHILKRAISQEVSNV